MIMNPTSDSMKSAQPELSIVIPALNEADNVAELVRQVDNCMNQAGIHFELIIIDDGSDDDTLNRLTTASASCPRLKILHRDRPMGQSAAMYAGIQAASGHFIATLDADLQNDPADIPRMLELLKTSNVDLVQGDRSAARRDNVVRQFASKIGRAARTVVLGDSVRDTGCSARVVRSEIAKQFPLQYKGIHRFLPVYARQVLGARLIETHVNHRPRTAGKTKYGLGLFNRAFAGFVDCFAVRWMIRRFRNPHTQVIDRS